jgi:hypothetical protein
MSCSNKLYTPFLMQDGREFTDYRPQSETYNDFVNKVCEATNDQSCCSKSDSLQLKKCVNNNLSTIANLISNEVLDKSNIRKC